LGWAFCRPGRTVKTAAMPVIPPQADRVEAPPGLEGAIASAGRFVEPLPSERRAAATSGVPAPSFMATWSAEQELKDQLIKQVTEAVREHVEARTAAAVEKVLTRGQRAMQHLQRQQMMQMDHLQGQLASCLESYRSLERENLALKTSLEALMKHLTLVLGPPPGVSQCGPAPQYFPQSTGILPPQASDSVTTCGTQRASAGLPADGASGCLKVPWAGEGMDRQHLSAGSCDVDAARIQESASDAPKPQASAGSDEAWHAMADQVSSLETAPRALSPKRHGAATDFVPEALAPAVMLDVEEATAGSAGTPPCSGPKVQGAGRKSDASSPVTTAGASSAASPSTVGGRSPPESGSSPTGSALPAGMPALSEPAPSNSLAPMLPRPSCTPTTVMTPTSASWPSAAAASTMPSFTLTLRRADNVPLGLDVRGEPGDRCLIVEAVRPGGAVEAWNRLCAGDSREMRAGDHIVAINGAEDADSMHKECLTRHLLRMTVCRVSKPTTPQISSPFASATPAARSTLAPAATPGGTLRVEAHEFVPQAGASWPA